MTNCKYLKCSLCKHKLCYEDKEKLFQVIGHFNFGDKAYCITCFKKHEAEIIKGEL